MIETPLLYLKTLTPELVSKLLSLGYKTLESLSIADPNSLSTEIGLNKDKCVEIIREARSKLGYQFLTIKNISSQNISFTTGCQGLDRLLNGGIFLGEITLIYGMSGVGKSQICYQLSVTAQLNHEVNDLIVYVDAGNNFIPERILNITSRFNLSIDMLRKLYVYRPSNLKMFMKTLERSYVKNKNVKLIIVDDFMYYFRLEALKSLLEARKILVKTLLKMLDEIMSRNIAVIFTVDEVKYVDENGEVFEAPQGWTILNMFVSTQLHLKKLDTVRQIILDYSPRAAGGVTLLKITEKGVEDVVKE